MEALEVARLGLQADLDSAKTQAERNKLGQYATPTDLATEIVRYAKRRLPRATRVRFLDPAFGTGSFFSALTRVFPPAAIEAATGYEIDAHYAEPAKQLWDGSPLQLSQCDFTSLEAPACESDRYNLLVCNPPYVRHHHIASEAKPRLRRLAADTAGMGLNGLAGLYCYFIALSHAWMADDGLAAWLVPSEFMDVNYGRALKEYFLSRVSLLRIHRFDPNAVQFGDALVSSAVVFFRKRTPSAGHTVSFTYGGTLSTPEIRRDVPVDVLRHETKWTRYPRAESRRSNPQGVTLGDLFTIKRGLATGDNSFFILSGERLAEMGLAADRGYTRPVLPSPRYLKAAEIQATAQGTPRLDSEMHLIDCRVSESELPVTYPDLHRYFTTGGQVSKRYLCRHRKPWYAQENRPPAPIVCTYMGRGDIRHKRPFRFILNHSEATATNVYLMLYPKQPFAVQLKSRPELMREVWTYLNELPAETLLGEGRVYGGGLHKLEPRELANVPAPFAADLGLAPLAPRLMQGHLWDQ